jgi:hypothetical protein
VVAVAVMPVTAIHEDYQTTHCDGGPCSLRGHIALDHLLNRVLDCPILDVETGDRGPAPGPAPARDFYCGVHLHRDYELDRHFHTNPDFDFDHGSMRSHHSLTDSRNDEARLTYHVCVRDQPIFLYLTTYSRKFL